MSLSDLQKLRKVRKELIHIAGCKICSRDTNLYVLRETFEEWYQNYSCDMFNSIRVPRSLQPRWNSRLLMKRDDDGNILSQDWPELEPYEPLKPPYNKDP